MRELLYAAQRLRIAVLRLKHDARAQRGGQTALSRNAELGREFTMCVGDNVEGHKGEWGEMGKRGAIGAGGERGAEGRRGTRGERDYGLQKCEKNKFRAHTGVLVKFLPFFI